jgi:hypothetical protein
LTSRHGMSAPEETTLQMKDILIRLTSWFMKRILNNIYK